MTCWNCPDFIKTDEKTQTPTGGQIVFHLLRFDLMLAGAVHPSIMQVHRGVFVGSMGIKGPQNPHPMPPFSRRKYGMIKAIVRCLITPKNTISI